MFEPCGVGVMVLLAETPNFGNCEKWVDPVPEREDGTCVHVPVHVHACACVRARKASLVSLWFDMLPSLFCSVLLVEAFIQNILKTVLFL